MRSGLLAFVRDLEVGERAVSRDREANDLCGRTTPNRNRPSWLAACQLLELLVARRKVDRRAARIVLKNDRPLHAIAKRNGQRIISAQEVSQDGSFPIRQRTLETHGRSVVGLCGFRKPRARTRF